MPNYVVLLKFTEEGRKTLRDVSGLDQAKQAVQAMGVQWKDWYLTLGHYDAVVLVEAPDDETVARVALAQAGTGGVVSETLRAFSEDEFRQLVASLPPAQG